MLFRSIPSHQSFWNLQPQISNPLLPASFVHPHETHATPWSNETTPPPVTREVVQTEAWNLVFENTPIAAAVLVRELSVEPLAALQIASKAISALMFCLSEGMGNSVYLNSPTPAWAVAAMDGDLSSPDLIKALENVAAMAADLLTGDEPQADELPS